MSAVICYSCMTVGAEFYINKNTNKRAAYCKSCNTKFTAAEKKKNVLNNTIKIISDMDKNYD